jgi:hypothetical protein
MSIDTEGDAAQARLLALLDETDAKGRTLDFWWRDDDAEDATPALDRLLDLAVRYDLPLALAVVPKGATEALAARVRSTPHVAVLQHGWAHENHATTGEKRIELGGTQPLPETVDQLRRGRERLISRFADRFLPVLVPPWNRIADDVRNARVDVGLAGLSTSGPAKGEPHQVNVHLDIFAWRPTRRTLSRAETYPRLTAEVARRLAGDDEPVGIMTHHLVHDTASSSLLDELLDTLAKHPATRWPEIGELFGI